MRLYIIFFASFVPINNKYAEQVFSQRNLHFPRVQDSLDQIGKSYGESNSSLKNKFAVVTASALNLRSSPRIENNIIKVLPKGTHVLSLSQTVNNWIKVKINYDIKGWVAEKYLNFYLPKSLPYSKDKFHKNSFSSILEESISSETFLYFSISVSKLLISFNQILTKTRLRSDTEILFL